MKWREGFSGTGPGIFTPDGCAVSLYERLKAGSEPYIISLAVPAGGNILELGCGTGRVTKALLQRGFTVTAVDESAHMLSRVHGARTVLSPIESLDLGELFDTVLLGSFLIHAPEPSRARALLATCARHVKPGGCVLIQREGADWHTNVPRQGPLAGGIVRVASSTEVRPGVRSVHVEYEFTDASWTHTFLSHPLTDAAFTALLATAGLRLDSYLTADHTWALARLGSPTSQDGSADV
jgi:SAM-dependent methyltransferase